MSPLSSLFAQSQIFPRGDLGSCSSQCHIQENIQSIIATAADSEDPPPVLVRLGNILLCYNKAQWIHCSFLYQTRAEALKLYGGLMSNFNVLKTHCNLSKHYSDKRNIKLEPSLRPPAYPPNSFAGRFSGFHDPDTAPPTNNTANLNISRPKSSYSC
ncbi:hypothetical protein CIHG_08058 [Coccidioides immitis H538.4]|uniref:Uncharacterized protein n=1 Tax=Coccidioides immitis H538.4 TaxID=396776 RepID=A0A0J8URK4_COCIT|nr:hypothetical protein CIHG_08058 [Coccidioides immitis H538.4]